MGHQGKGGSAKYWMVHQSRERVIEVGAVPSEPALEHVSAAGLHFAPLSDLDVLKEVVIHSKGKTEVLPVGGHTDNVVKQLQHGRLGVEEGVCGEEGHTLTTGGPYSTQHYLEDTQDSDVV